MAETRLGATWYFGTGAQQAMFDNTPPTHRFFVMHHGRRGRAYASFTDAMVFKHEAFDQEHSSRHFFELIRSSCLPYFDLEWDPRLHPVSRDDVLKAVVDVLVAEFRKQYDKELQPDHFLFTCSSKPEKESFHLVIRPDPIFVFETVLEQKHFMKRLEQQLLDQHNPSLAYEGGSHPTVFDTSVYSRNRTMRTCGSSKIDEPSRVFEPHPASTRPWEHYLITDFAGANPEILPRRAPNAAARESRHLAAASTLETLQQHPLATRVLEAAQRLGEQVSIRTITRKSDSKVDFYLQRTSTGTRRCAISGEAHDGTNNCYAVLRELGCDHRVCVMRCYSARCYARERLLFEDLPRVEVPRHVAGPVPIPLDLRHLTAKDVKDWDRDQIQQAKDMLDALRQTRSTMMLRSPMDTGKTAWLEAALEQDNGRHFRRILIISCRQSLAVSFSGRFRRLGFKCYQDPTCDLLHDDRVIVQLDSIVRLRKEDGSYVMDYDLIILDEAESLLHYLQSKTLKKRRKESFDMLCHFLDTAKAVFACDADLGARAWHFIATARKHATTTLFENMRKVDTKKYIFVPSFESWAKKLIELLEDGKRVAIAVNDKAVADKLYAFLQHRFPDKRLQEYSRDSSGRDRKEVADCNTLWLELDILIYTPTIGCGVDFNPPDPHFDVLFAYGTATANSAREFKQQLGRIRKPRSGQVYLYLKTYKVKTLLPETTDEICDHIKREDFTRLAVTEAYRKELPRLFKTASHTDSDSKTRYNPPLEGFGVWHFDQGSLFHDILVANIQEANRSRNRFQDLLRTAILAGGGEVENAEETLTKTERKQLRQEIEQAGKNKKDEGNKNIVDALDLDDNTRQRTKRRIERGTDLPQDRERLTKDYLKSFFQLKRVDIDFVEKWSDRTADMKNFCELVMPLSTTIRNDLKNHLRQYASTQDGISKRFFVHALLGACGFGTEEEPTIGSVLSDRTITTSGIEQQLLADDGMWQKWLKEQFSHICNTFKITTWKERDEWTPGDLVAFTNTVLSRYCGLRIEQGERKQHRVTLPDGSRPSTSSYPYFLKTDPRDEMIELASYRDKSLNLPQPAKHVWAHLLEEDVTPGDTDMHV